LNIFGEQQCSNKSLQLHNLNERARKMLKHSFNDRALMFDIVGLKQWRERDANKDTKKNYEKLRFMLFSLNGMN
jgi:hypothetical protein